MSDMTIYIWMQREVILDNRHNKYVFNNIYDKNIFFKFYSFIKNCVDNYYNVHARKDTRQYIFIIYKRNA